MRIVIVAEELNSVVWTFANSLHQQKQEVLVLTSRKTVLHEAPPFTVYSTFKKWSAIEALKMLPRLISWNPDVFHFFYTDDSQRRRPAHWVISAFAAGLPNKTVAASFFAETGLRTLRDRAFLQLFDVNTFATRSQLMRMKRKKFLPAKSISEILPPIESEILPDGKRIRSEVEKLVQTLDRYVIVPSPLPKNFPIQLLNKHGYEVLVLSERFRPRSPYYSTGALSHAERNLVFSKAKALFLAECDLSVLELRRFRELSEKNQLPVFATAYQNEILPGLCWHLKSGWILDQGLASLEKVLDDNAELALPRTYSGFSGQELMDNTLNELLRLYQKAFLRRWT